MQLNRISVLKIKQRPMEFKKLDKAQKYYEQVKKLDAEIIEIEKLAQLMADGGKVSFKISCEPKVNHEKQKVLDSDGSLIIHDGAPRLSFSFSSIWGVEKVKAPKPKHPHIKGELTDTLGLTILGVLLADKQKQKALITKRLEKIMA